MTNNRAESLEQRTLVAWCNDLVNWGIAPELRWLHAIPNGGPRDGRTAALLVAEGVRAGVADLFLPVARRGVHGLYIEMKVPGGRVQPKQLEFGEFVITQGYMYRIVWSVREGQDLLIWYLGIRDDPRIIMFT